VLPRPSPAAQPADEKAAAAGRKAPTDVYYMKQTIGNACGTIAMLHSFGNNLGTVQLSGCSRCPGRRAAAAGDPEPARAGGAAARHCVRPLGRPRFPRLNSYVFPVLEPPAPALSWGASVTFAAGPTPRSALRLQNPAAAPGSFLERFFEATKGMSPQERGRYLETPPSGAPDIEEAHQVGRGEGRRGWDRMASYRMGWDTIG
jgi:hypothetical protein